VSSSFKCEVVRLGEIGKHPNADSLGVLHVYGFQVITKLDEWHEGDLAVYIPPDSVVPDTEEYAWLEGHRRITVRRFRGLYSMGLLVHAPEGMEPGDDAAEQLGIVHYEPELKQMKNAYTAGDAETPPIGFRPRYDVEHYLRYASLFQPGELVVCTEKIHGANGRWTFQDDRYHAGSHNEWKKWDEAKPSIWWKVLRANPRVEDFLIRHPGTTLYGEVYGCVQDLRYGHKDGEVSVRFFDLWDGNQARFLNHDEAREVGASHFGDELWVPEVYRGPADPENLAILATGQSTLSGADHYREGIVIKPPIERYVYDLGGGRLQLKLVNPLYLEQSGKRS
jgi:RNA ligase (TIGR02306 family)